MEKIITWNPLEECGMFVFESPTYTNTITHTLSQISLI